jgi:protease-4
VNVGFSGVRAPVQEYTVRPSKGTFVWDKIALVELNGVIGSFDVDGGVYRQKNTVMLLREKLERAEADPLVRAVLLRISSPGGGVTASDILHEEIQAFRKRSEKKVVVWMMDVAASGGFYAAMAGDRVLAHPTCVTGSIGVIAGLLNVAKLADWAGVESTPVKSGPKKDMGSVFRRMTDEEKAIFQSVIDEYHDRFVSVVAAARPNLDEARVRAVADGRIMTARQALKAGLIDKVCTLDGAIEETMDAAGIDDARVIMYGRPNTYMANVYATETDTPAPRAAAPASLPAAALELLRGRRPVFLYLWQP